MPRPGTHEVGRRFELTPKQRQVMELMAQGRTNFEIAQALGLSLEGAKYHVSEILAKFDVASREEAVAAWRAHRSPAARAKRFLAGLPGLLPGSAAAKGVTLALVAAGVVAIAWVTILALGRDSDVIDDPADITTPEQFLAAMEDRLSRDGQVLQVAMETTIDDDGDGTGERAWSNRAWLDLSREQARIEFEKDPSFEADISEAHTELYVGPDLYHRDPDDDEAQKGDVTELAGCLADQESLLEILVCGGYPYNAAEPLQLKVNMGASYAGKPAVAFEMSETVTPGDPFGGTKPPVVVTRTFYAEPDTFLPVAFTITTPPDSGVRGDMVTTYAAAFVDQGSLPADLFDPAALGYRTPDEKEAELFANPRLGGEVYWLGRSFDPGAGLPALQDLSVEDWYHPERPVLIQLTVACGSSSGTRASGSTSCRRSRGRTAGSMPAARSARSRRTARGYASSVAGSTAVSWSSR
jgi:DNA-binding CsgD family transcriptional regulator